MSLELDKVDLKIISILIDNARIPLQELADKVGFSRVTVSERVKKLREKGVIEKYQSVIDSDMLGYSVLAWVGLSTVQGKESYRTLEDLKQILEIESAYVVTGQFDILVKIRAKNNAHLQQILFEQVDQVYGFKKSETMVVLSAAVEKNGLDSRLVDSLAKEASSVL